MYTGGKLYMDTNNANTACTASSTSSSSLTEISSFDSTTTDTAIYSGAWGGTFVFNPNIDPDPLEIAVKNIQLNQAGQTFTAELQSSGCFAPSAIPSLIPSSSPSSEPTSAPSSAPSSKPSSVPSLPPTSAPSAQPSSQPSSAPSSAPSSMPTLAPFSAPSSVPTNVPSSEPSMTPFGSPSSSPTAMPTMTHSSLPTLQPRCGVADILGKTYFVEVTNFGAPLCLKIDMFPGGTVAIDPNNSDCTPANSNPTIVSYFDSATDATPYDAGGIMFVPGALGVDGYTGDFSFVEEDGETAFKTLYLDSPNKSFTGKLCVQSCTAPSNHPSIHPTDLPSLTPSINPTDIPSVIPSSKPSSQPSLLPTMLPSQFPSLAPSVTPTPVCNVADPLRVGDGWCDDDQLLFYTARCNFDDGDCDAIYAQYPDCPQHGSPLTWLGDCICDDVLNNADCGFDDGDCLPPLPDTCEELPKHKKDDKVVALRRLGIII